MRLMTRHQVADVLGVCVRTIDGLVADGSIPVVRLGRLVRVEEEVLRRFVEARTDV